MRLYHILIALLIFSLFSTILYKTAVEIENGYGLTTSSLLTNTSSGKYNNATAIFDKLNIVTQTGTDIGAAQKLAPGGSDSLTPDESSTNEGSIQKSGLQSLFAMFSLIYILPTTIIGGTSDYFGVDPMFTTVAISSIILIVISMGISLVMKGRL